MCVCIFFQDLQKQMPKACEILTVSGKNLVVAAQRVAVEKFSSESRRYLVRAAKDVLEGTLKVNSLSVEM